MVRTQIQLTEQQAAALKQMAAVQSVSMAELIRQAVDQMVESAEPDNVELRRRALAAVGRGKGGPVDLAARHDAYLVDAFGGKR